MLNAKPQANRLYVLHSFSHLNYLGHRKHLCYVSHRDSYPDKKVESDVRAYAMFPLKSATTTVGYIALL